MIRHLRGVAALLGAALALATRAGAVTYTVTDLGNTHQINGHQSKVLNDSGQVIANDIGPNGHAFLYANGTWNDLGQLNTSGSGNTATLARGLNNTGLVVGQSDTGRANANQIDQSDAFFRAGVAGTFTPLALVSAGNLNENAIAYGCNDLGVIVGNVLDYAAGTRDTFLYKPGAGFISRSSDGIYSFAINRYGDVLGSVIGLQPQAALNGVTLPASAAGFTPQAINNAGQILLSADDVHALPAGWGLIYDYGTGKATSLSNLSSGSGGYTTFLDINDLGAVVGRGSDENLNPHAVLHLPGEALASLDDLGLTVGGNAVHLTEAHGVNNAGQIVCIGYTSDATDVHGYLLTPDNTPVLPLTATYDGMASVAGANLGLATIAVSKTNVASVKLVAPGVSDSFKVTLTNGGFSGPVTIKTVTLNVALQADAPHQKITGTIAAGGQTYDIAALRRSKLGIFTGSYTALLQIPGVNAGLPQGIGYGQLKIGKTGGVKITGKLGDGATYSVSTVLHCDGSWSFYAPLYTKTAQPGSIAGTMAFDRTAAESDCAATLKWSKPGEFTTDVACKAALFKPAKESQVLRFTNAANGLASFTFAGGEQTIPAHTLAVSSENAVSITAPNPDPAELTVKLSGAKGSLSGSFLSDAGAKTSFVGVIQQKLNRAGGVFSGPTTEGGVLLTPQ